MPFEKRTGSEAETERNFDEFRHGKKFAKTRRKHGAKTARKQMIAAVLSNKRKAAAKKKHHHAKKRVAGK
jgi:hypothetical protein